MSRPRPVSAWSAEDYEQAARDYLHRLPLEHFMEAMPQATQREITLASLAVLRGRRPDVQVFNDMLVQYPFNGGLGQVVPDNMVVLTDQPIQAASSYNLPFEAAAPLWVLEYVSPTNRRKDYVDSFRKYEQELRVPYYLLFYPDGQDLRLYHHTGVAYELAQANARGRLELPELDLEIAILDDWVRYWHQGKLLELLATLDERVQHERALRLRAERRARRERQRAEEEKHRAAQAQRQIRKAERQLAEARQQQAAAEAENQRLRALLEQLQGRPAPPAEEP
jgi:Uma2 family endonuclease